MTVVAPQTDRSRLLEEDPGFVLGIPPEERDHATQALTVPIIECRSGALDLAESTTSPTLGVVILSGFAIVSVGIVDRSVAQIVGPGDVLHPGVAEAGSVPLKLTYEVLRPVRMAVLDRRFLAASRRWPGLLLVLQERTSQQERQLYLHAAAAKLRRSEDRVLAVLWHLADSWGHMTPKGVTLPVHPSHATLGRLTGASRPTVSLAVKALLHEGHVLKDDAGHLVLHRDSWRVLDPGSPTRPRGAKAVVVPAAGPQFDVPALLARVAALHDDFDGRVRTTERALADAAAAIEANAAVRRRAREARKGG